MKKTKKVITLMLAILCCSTISAGAAPELNVTADKTEDQFISYSDESNFEYNDLYGLYATVTEAPDPTYASDNGEPDFTGVKFTVYSIDKNGVQNAMLTDVTLDELKTAFDVKIENVPLIPSGIMSKITLSAFSNTLHETVSTSVELTFSKRIKNDALSELRMELVTQPDNVVISDEKDLDFTGMTLSVYETYVDGTVVQTLTNATLDEAEKMYNVKIKKKNDGSGGGTCTITVGSYSEAQYREIYASDSFNYVLDSPTPEYLRGDVNSDNKFNISDVVLLQKWLLAVPDTNLANWKAADLYEDGRLDSFDLCLMRREIIDQIDKEVYPVENPEVIDEFTPCDATIDSEFDDWLICVVIKCQYSVEGREWTIEDFNGVDNIKKISQRNSVNPYRQILDISLNEKSKENVLKLVHDIESLGLVEIKNVEVVSFGMGA